MLKKVKAENDHYMLRKVEESDKLRLTTHIIDNSNFFSPEAQRLRTFYMIGGSKDQMFASCAEQIKRTLAMLDAQK